MNLAEIVKYGAKSIATATPAAPATHDKRTVATVATVAAPSGGSKAKEHGNPSPVPSVATVAAIEAAENVYVFRTKPLQACGGCKHYRRIDHPHLGHCSIQAESEPIVGLWDTDPRDHCKVYEALNR